MAFYTTVRYGKMVLVGRARVERADFRPRDRCIVRTDRGKELATILSPLEEVPETTAKEALYEILRKASPEDVTTGERIEKESRSNAKKYCQEQAKQLGLPMKIVEVDYLFGGERVIFYFTSPQRVDFRELVRRLARELRTRVELRQIGGRDEARLVGDCGHCGLSLCCRGFIKELGGITMEMTKIQKHTSDPSKITGRCGKLLCCLRYEYSAYSEARDLLPPRGAVIATRKGEGPVVDQNLLLREVTIEPPGGQRIVVKLDEIVGTKDVRVAGCTGCDEPKGGSEEKAEVGLPVAVAEPEPEPGPPMTTEEHGKIDEDTKTDLPAYAEAAPGPPQPPGPPPQVESRRRRRRRRRGRGPPGMPPAGGPPPSIP